MAMTFYGPTEIPQEELSLEFTVSNRVTRHREQVVAKLFIIPHPYSASTQSQKGVNLQDIKDEAERLLRYSENRVLDVDELLQISLNRVCGAQPGEILKSPLLQTLKNKIDQVIHGCFVNEGEVLTQKDVITNQGCLCPEADQDEGKRMKQNLEKIDALLEIPYDGEIRTAKARGRVAGMS